MLTNDYLPAPQNMGEALKLADVLSKSQIVPKGYQGRPYDIFVASWWSHNLGIPPIQGLQHIAVINGKPSIYGDAALAIVRASGLLELFKEEIVGEGLNMVAKCTVKRKGEEPIVSTFSVADAKLAGLWDKQGPWRQYPKRMLKMRARSFALRDGFGDKLNGIGIAEEQQDIEERDIRDFASGAMPDGGRESVNGEVTPPKPRKKSAAKKAEPAPAAIADESNKPNPLAPVFNLNQTEPEKVPVEPVHEEAAVEEEKAAPIPDVLAGKVANVEAQVETIDNREELFDFYRSLPDDVKPLVKEAFAKRKAQLEA